MSKVRRVLFVCIGNSCRSQMAEGFARRYGADVMEAESAGIAPANIVQPSTIQVMTVKNIDISGHQPKSIHELELASFDIVINMTGAPLAASWKAETRTWTVADPMGQPEEAYIRCRDTIEALVMRLIMELRRRPATTAVVADTRKPTTKAVEPVATKRSPYRFGRMRNPL